MKTLELDFARPSELQAAAPPEARGLARDEVRLLVSTADGHSHSAFVRLADYLRPGDLLVVNRSATLPASLPAERLDGGQPGCFLLNLSTNYGGGLWVAEPRRGPAEPGPLPLAPGDWLCVAGVRARLAAPYPGLPRLWFVQFEPGLEGAMARHGAPIRYAYLAQPYPLAAYQTIFAGVPGSAEMPSAARPFSRRVLARLRRNGVRLAGIVLHTGVSSLEIESDEVEQHTLYAEPYSVPRATAWAVNRARAAGQRVIAVGTTVVRALESAWDGSQVQPVRGFTRLYVHPARGARVADGLLTGLHDPRASHLAMLFAVAGRALIMDGYAEAVRHGYLWHEFGDSHLILP